MSVQVGLELETSAADGAEKLRQFTAIKLEMTVERVFARISAVTLGTTELLCRLEPSGMRKAWK